MMLCNFGTCVQTCSEESAAAVVHPEDGTIKFLQHICVCVCVCVCVYVCVCMYVCMYVCMCMYVRTHTHAHIHIPVC